VAEGAAARGHGGRGRRLGRGWGGARGAARERGSAAEAARGGGGVGERRKNREGRERDGRGANHVDPNPAINVSKT
jgi:hypothetical protein